MTETFFPLSSIGQDGRLVLNFHAGQMAAYESEARIVIVLAGAQSGKALDVATPIPMADGTWKQLGEIEAGDMLLDENNRPTKVLQAHEPYRSSDTWRLLTGGGVVYADSPHLWSVDYKDGKDHIISTGRLAAIRRLYQEVKKTHPLKTELSFKLRFSDKKIYDIQKSKRTRTVRCLTVDSPNHLYLCGEHKVPTHNTTFGPHWLAREISRRGPGDYLVVAPTYPLMSLKVGPEFKRLFSQRMKWGKYTGGASPKFVLNDYGARWLFQGQVRPDDPPTQVFFSHAQDPEALASSTVKAVWCDEAGQKKFRLGSFEEIQGRVAVFQGRILITTTPYGSGWFKELCDRCKIITPWGKVQPHHVAPNVAPPRIEIVHFKSIMNPAFPLEEYEESKRTMPKWRFDLKYNAIFTRPAGVIYDCYDSNIHKVYPFPVPDHWPRYLGLDFGGVHTAGVLLAAELDGTGHETGKLFLYREYPAAARWQARPTWEHAREIKKGERIAIRYDGKGGTHAETGSQWRGENYQLLKGNKDDPPGSPFKRAVGGSKSEDKWREEFRAAGIQVMEPPVSDVEVGINRVYSALQKQELFIFSSCIGVLDQLEGYTRELDDRGEPTEKIEDKADFHYCFVAGTLVETDRGARPIESLQVGDRVLTRVGYRLVESLLPTRNQPVREVKLSNDRTLIGTLDHPIWIQGKGFTRLDALRYNDRVLTPEDLLQVQPCQGLAEKLTTPSLSPTVLWRLTEVSKYTLRNWYLQGWSGNDIWKETERLSIITNGGERTEQSIFTNSFGSCITGLLKQDFRSTTRTGTNWITVRSIWKKCQRQITEHYTTLKCLKPPKCGTSQRKEELGTGVIPRNKWLSELKSCWTRFVCDVEHLTKRNLGSIADASLNSALTNAAATLATIRGLITSEWPALCAGLNLSRTNMHGPNIVPVRVVEMRDVNGLKTVYNLTVADAHEYFANGVLVANCDSVRYIISYLKGGKKEANLW